MQVDLEEMTRLWNDTTIRNDELARRLGVPQVRLQSLRHRFRLPRRYGREPPQKELTTAEIRRRAAEIRRGWTSEEREKRRVGPRRKKWVLPAFDYDKKHAVFTATT